MSRLALTTISTAAFALAGPYFHAEKAVAIMERTQLGQALAPQDLSDIVAFLKSLTGDQPKATVPALPPVTGTTARPVY